MGSCLLIFAKAPLPGQVKTRLQPPLDSSEAVSLHVRLLAHTLHSVVSCNADVVELHCDQADNETILRLADQQHIAVKPQYGFGLGERMALAFERAFASYGQVVLIGSDCPEMDANYVDTALRALAAGKDVVVGPAVDGGYVMIAMCSAQPALFDGIPWGTGDVLTMTRQQLRRDGLDWLELPALRDLDRPEDLDWAMPLLTSTPASNCCQ